MNSSTTDPTNSGPSSTENSEQSDAEQRPPGKSQDAPGPPPTDDADAHEAVEDSPDPVEAPN